MQIMESQGKDLLARHGINVPKGYCSSDLDHLMDSLEKLGGCAVLKAQFPFGGRGKHGFVKKVNGVQELRKAYEDMKSKSFNGLFPHEFLLEELSAKGSELFISETINYGRTTKEILMSAQGGIDVEETQDIQSFDVNRYFGPSGFQIREAMASLKLNLDWKPVADLAIKLDRLFDEVGARTIELNPMLHNGQEVIALDAHVVLDDALIKKDKNLGKLAAGVVPMELTDQVRIQTGLEYVKLGGNIGLISGGAGMTMAVLDLIKDYGGKPACFLDASANPTREGYSKAFELLLSDSEINVILVSIHGGLTLMDKVAANLVGIIRSLSIDTPVVFRLRGTNSESASEILSNSGFRNFLSLEEAVKTAVELSEV